MRTVRSVFLAASTAFCLGAANPAAAVVATASLDWANLQIFTLGIPGSPAPSYMLTQQFTNWSTNATTVNDSNDYHTHSAANWTSSLSITSDTPNASAAALASSAAFSTNAATSDSFSSNPFLTNTAGGSVSRSATLLLNQPMAVIFSVPYSISVDGPQFDFSRHAMASVSGSAAFSPNVCCAFENSSRSFSLDSYYGGSSALNGTMFFGLVVDAEGVLNVSFSAVTSATSPDPVPEPSVALSLLAGLGVLCTIFRRRLAGGGWLERHPVPGVMS